MKRSRLTLDIIGIIVSFLASVVFYLPVCYFTSTTTINDQTNILIKTKARIFEVDTIENITTTYSSYNHTLNLTFSYIFQLLSIATMLLELVFIILTIISISQKYDHSIKLFKTSKIVSILIIVSALLSLVSALIFTEKSTITLVDNTNIHSTLSIDITSGIYLFIIFTIFSGISGYVANNMTINNE